MSDKNPKHPLKKKKVAAKVNMADHEAVEEAREAHKSKKHVYEAIRLQMTGEKGQGAAQHEVLCAPCPFLRPKITHSLIQLHGVEFFCQQSQETLAEIT